MDRERYLSILAFFHIADNGTFLPADNPDHDPIHKIRPFIKHLNIKFKEVYEPRQDICIDEAMVPFKGLSKFKVFMKDKPTKWGFKLYELCESGTGYVYNLEMYCADKRISNKLVDVTMRLMEPLLNKGYKLYLDNYYCCPELWTRLQRHRTMIVGTCRKNRVGMPRDLFVERQRQGDLDFRRKGQLIVTRWFDKREKWWKKPFFHLLTLVSIQTTIILNLHKKQHGRPATNLAAVVKDLIIALVDKDVSYDAEQDNVNLPLARIRERHFIKLCPEKDGGGKSRRTQEAHELTLLHAKALAMAAVDVYKNPNLIAQMKSDFQQQKKLEQL
ncbi:hypothetical protein RRG08_035485 [Elysia crispata]|uniref:PiggyBac transposable element-derived protein domain-containing protein n=1 Tax=Elysia crispata TaxID=231223 RepID=A0AAE1ASL4_9GAST|nr:hypothetical protein RRG08_035485 [Elysia crispata]